jgi:hypothetical protein
MGFVNSLKRLEGTSTFKRRDGASTLSGWKALLLFCVDGSLFSKMASMARQNP